MGSLLGSLNAFVIQPLGHIAGTGAAVMGAMSVLIFLNLGIILTQSSSGPLMSMAVSVFLFSAGAVVVLSNTP